MRKGKQPKTVPHLPRHRHVTWFWPRRCKWKQCVPLLHFLKVSKNILLSTSFLLFEVWCIGWSPVVILRHEGLEKRCHTQYRNKLKESRVPDVHGTTVQYWDFLPPDFFYMKEKEGFQKLYYEIHNENGSPPSQCCPAHCPEGAAFSS